MCLIKRSIAITLLSLAYVSLPANALVPVNTIDPTGSSANQAVVSSGPATAPAWGNVSATSLSGAVPILNGGTGASTAAGALAGLGAQPAGSPSNKDLYVSLLGNDANDGSSWGLAKLTIQAAVTAAGGSTGGTVHVGAGTFSLTAPVAVPPRVRLLCVDGATIQQAISQNLSSLFSLADGDAVQNCTIDGNRASNTVAPTILLYVGAANDVTITGNTLKNGNGSGIDIASGVRTIVAYNTLTNFNSGAIYVIAPSIQTPTYSQIIGNTIYGPIGQHAISLSNSDFNLIEGNSIRDNLRTGMVVSVSGTTVTYVSGPNFSGLSPGLFMIMNGGVEALITAVTSSTSLTINLPFTLTNVPAATGPGDLLSLTNASLNTVSNNNITGGVGGGVVVSNFSTNESTHKNNIVSNSIANIGEGCIELESIAGSDVNGTQIRGNNLSDCGVGRTAVAPNTLFGIALIDFNPPSLLNTFVDDNYVSDDQGSPSTTYWMGLGNVVDGAVFVGRNTNVGTANNGIFGGISSVVPTGWGSAATVSGITSYGSSFVFTVTSNGTGQTAIPSVTVHTPATTSDNPPVMICKQTGGSAGTAVVLGEEPGSDSSPSLQVFVYLQQAFPGLTYQFMCRG